MPWAALVGDPAFVRFVADLGLPALQRLCAAVVDDWYGTCAAPARLGPSGGGRT